MERKNRLIRRRMCVDVELARESRDGEAPPSLRLLRRQLEASIRHNFMHIYHLEHVHAYVDLHIQRTCARPLRNQSYLGGLGQVERRRLGQMCGMERTIARQERRTRINSRRECA